MSGCSVRGIGWVASCGLGGYHSAPLAVFSKQPLPALKRQDVFAEVDRRFGRMDPFSRLGLAAITFALRDAGLEAWQQKRSVAVFAETSSGCLLTDVDYFATVAPQAGALASPQLFAYTLPNTFLGEAALRFGLTGNCQVVNCGGGDGLAVLRMAMDSLAWHEAEYAVAGYCDLGEHGALRAPGALFFVLDPQPQPDSLWLEMDSHQWLSCNGRALETPAQLLEVLMDCQHCRA